MLKKRNAQGLSITTIIIAVIGLIVIIVLITIFTGRIGGFGKGLDTSLKDVKTCSSLCGINGMDKTTSEKASAVACSASSSPEIETRTIPGTFTDVSDGNVCCCRRDI